LPNRLIGILKGYEWSVMFALRYHGCDCYPSHSRIAEIAGISVRTAQRTLESLRGKGLVSWTPRHREEGSQTSNFYQLHIDHLWNQAEADPGPVGLTDRPPRTHRPTPLDSQADEQDLLEQDLDEQEEIKDPPIVPPVPPTPLEEQPAAKEAGEPSSSPSKAYQPSLASIPPSTVLEPPSSPESPPPSKAATSKTVRLPIEKRVAEKMLRIYQENKPPAWAGRNVIDQATLALAMSWVNDLGEEAFYDVLEKALKQAHIEKFWGEMKLTLPALIRKTKTHLMDLSDKFNENKSRESRGLTGYNSSTSIGGPIRLTDEDIQKALYG